MTWVAVGTMVVGAYSAYANNKAAGKAGDQQQAMYQRDLDSREAFQRQQQQLYGPLEQKMIEQASSDQPLYYGQMSGAIQGNYDQAQRGLNTQMAMRGMSGSGLQGAQSTGLEMGRAGALSGAFQQGLQARTNLGMNVLQRYNPAQNQQNMQQGLGQMGGFYGQQAQNFGNAAQQGWGMVGQGAGALMQNQLLGGNSWQPAIPQGLGGSAVAGMQPLPVNNLAPSSYDWMTPPSSGSSVTGVSR